MGVGARSVPEGRPYRGHPYRGEGWQFREKLADIPIAVARELQTIGLETLPMATGYP